MAERHESLRTRFPQRDGVPYQDVLPAGVDLNVREVDDLDTVLTGLVHTPFDLEDHVPMRAELLAHPRQRILLLAGEDQAQLRLRARGIALRGLFEELVRVRPGGVPHSLQTLAIGIDGARRASR